MRSGGVSQSEQPTVHPGRMKRGYAGSIFVIVYWGTNHSRRSERGRRRGGGEGGRVVRVAGWCAQSRKSSGWVPACRPIINGTNYFLSAPTMIEMVPGGARALVTCKPGVGQVKREKERGVCVCVHVCVCSNNRRVRNGRRRKHTQQEQRVWCGTAV